MGRQRYNPPTIPVTVELIPHNQLLAHLFYTLTGCQAMQRLQIIPGKNRTIHSLLESEFPPIKSTNNKPTPYVTPQDDCDSITLHFISFRRLQHKGSLQ